MCGILAWIATGREAESIPLGVIAHRGPDDSGEWFSPDRRVWLGFTRLAIQDLSAAGAQPMQDPLTGNVIVFNGEIYNHCALREDPRLRDFAWRGTSDTETLLHAYRVMGMEVLDRIKGMFAFVIYDQGRRRVFAARDRFGIKPLYLLRNGANRILASECRAFPRRLVGGYSRSAIGHYLKWGAVQDEDLLWDNVETVQAGTWIELSSDGMDHTFRYWPKEGSFVREDTPDPHQIRGLVETSVAEHLRADVPVASFLSGGIDSSIITSLAAKGASTVASYTVGFDDETFDETVVAETVARRCGSQHRRIILNKHDVVKQVKEAVGHMDLPSVDAINTYIVSRAVNEQGIKVALSGLGGDELFGGYPSFEDAPTIRSLSLLPLRWLTWIPNEKWRRLADLEGRDWTSLANLRRRFWTNAMLAKAGFGADPAMPERYGPAGLDWFGQISWAEISGYMRNMLLRDADQMSMAVSLELRVPFLDHELVEHVLALPAATKRGRRYPKPLLVRQFQDILPKEVYDRPKMGFVLPMDDWMRGELADFVTEGLGFLRLFGVIAEPAISETQWLFQERRIHWTRVWSLVVLGHYLKRQERMTLP